MNYSRLNRLLEDRRISNAKLATLSGISAAAIGKILGGADLKVSSLVAIAKALNVPASFLLDEENGSNMVIGHQSIAGSGNTISGNSLGGVSPEKGGETETQKEGNYQETISTQKDEIICLQKRVMDLQEQLLNARK